MPDIVMIQTRLLFPFVFEAGAAQTAVDLLIQHRLAGKDELLGAPWLDNRPHGLYREEFLANVVGHLFGDGSGRSCLHLDLRPELVERWFQDVAFEGVRNASRKETVPIRPARRPNFEIFLSDFGVGLLSMGFVAEPDSCSTAEALAINYRLSQLPFGREWLERRELHKSIRDFKVGWFQCTRPSMDTKKVEAEPGTNADSEHKVGGSTNASSKPLHQRVGVGGGRFALYEVVSALLEPLASLALRPVQGQLSVYTVVRFDASVDFSDASVRTLLGPFLSSLAQVEEPAHAGVDPSDLGVENVVLNRKHWTAVGRLGAAHLIADQSGAGSVGRVAFDDERLPRAYLKYFVPFLAARLQALTLHRAVEQASKIAGGQETDEGPAVQHLRSELLLYNVSGMFDQVSTREALHRWYRLCQRGLDVPAYLGHIRGVLGELDTLLVSREQLGQTAAMKANIVALASMQRKIEYIEALLVGVYAAHLWEMSTAHHADVAAVEWIEHHLSPLASLAHNLGIHRPDVLFVGVGCLVATLLLLRPWKKHEGQQDCHGSSAGAGGSR